MEACRQTRGMNLRFALSLRLLSLLAATFSLGAATACSSGSNDSRENVDAGNHDEDSDDDSDQKEDAGRETKEDAGTSTKKDAGLKDSGSTSTPGAPTLKNLSYGLADSSHADITFSYSGSGNVAKVTGFSVSFPSSSTFAYSVDCADEPWTSSASQVVTLKLNASQLTYPCSGANYGSGSSFYYLGSGTMTFTVKGILDDASPWSVSATGSLR